MACLFYGCLSEGAGKLTLKVAMIMSEITAISKWFREVLQGCKLAVTLVMFSLLHCYDWYECSGTLQMCHALTFSFFSECLFCCCQCHALRFVIVSRSAIFVFETWMHVWCICFIWICFLKPKFTPGAKKHC